MSEFFFRTSELSVGYNGKALIKDIEIRVRSGEILTPSAPTAPGSPPSSRASPSISQPSGATASSRTPP